MHSIQGNLRKNGEFINNQGGALLHHNSPTPWSTFAQYLTLVVWLATKIARSDPASPYSKGISLSFWTSFWLQFINVKIILYGITALSTFVLPYTKDALWVISVSVLLAIIGTVGNVCWAAAGHLFQAILRHYGRALNIVLSGLLFWIAIDMFI
ncbi:hypothetical protein H0I68_19205 [Yersinia kristensenii]|uniref:hypothetical protein n=1 Tax=Yersinia kristensenii TaxID=28152 RepID=UPI001C60D028|nr:hypothetical protein [Yersinia kristensenii]MBW5827167.1 hypothetical protein [Yersinia kristensenii]